MADEHRHAHAGGDQLDIGIENLLRLDHHLEFLVGEAGILEVLDMRDDVERDLLGEQLRFDRIGDEHRARLAEQLVHRRLARAGHRLVGRHHHALDGRGVVQRLQRHHQLGGRAVRVGDDAFLDAMLQHVRVHFRHHQRHLAIHAPVRGIVDHQRAVIGDLRRPFLGHRRAGRHQADVGVAEIEMLQRLHLEDLVAERHRGADRAGGGDRHHFAGGEFPLRQHIQHFAADISCRADHGNFEGHGKSS